jgi:arsenate reductase
MKKKVLFVCVHNSARSQMAEEYLRKLGGSDFEVESAGFEPTIVNPLVVQVMNEEGINLSGKSTKNVYDLLRASRFFGYVITVCDRAKERECPVFPGMGYRAHWDLEDPETFTGTEQERLDKVRALRDRIKILVTEFIAEQS